ncbi:MAG: NAD-dependent malic enzyme [Myxococcales bacterium]|nr:NAD-dependent malic enzyme [Myxococcales bacterium]
MSDKAGSRENVLQPLRGPLEIRTRKRGVWVLKNPAVNKDLAYTRAERRALGIAAMLPTAVHSIEQQVRLELEHVHAKRDNLERYIGLISLLSRNEVLFYRVLVDHLAELMPIIYTPTVGDACRRYSHILRQVRGIWLTPDDIDELPARLREYPYDDVRLIVVTDNERILGLGDQGAGGMGIPVGKLALYVAGAGIHPSKTLPISLDVGTDNTELLADPEYVGYRRRRLRGEGYDRFIAAFVGAVREVFPAAVLQWEDFAAEHAYRLLSEYRDDLPCFNDDIQGTAAVVVAGQLAAIRLTGTPLREQRILYIGAGEACGGACRLMRATMRRAGVDARAIERAQLCLDRRGLLCASRRELPDHKQALAASDAVLAHHGLTGREQTAEEVIERFRPTALIGATGSPGAFRQSMIEAISRHVERPVIMALSNPGSRAECSASEALRWSEGRALVATGSPSADVVLEGRRHVIGQSNNCFVFPGIGLGAIVAQLPRVDDDVFAVAAEALAECVSDERLEQGALYPPVDELRSCSERVAVAVIRHARALGLVGDASDEQIERVVADSMWDPAYLPVTS